MFSKPPFISQTPVAVAYTPNSILKHTQAPVPYQSLMNRRRYSTCTDVAWFNNNNYLAVLNFATETIHIYEFDRQDHSLTLIQTLNNKNGMQLSRPDKLAFSPNGLYLAITNIKSNSLNMYHVDPQTHRINPVPFKVLKHRNSKLFHGVQFSPNSQYMVTTTIDGQGLILIYRLDYKAKGVLDVTLTQVVENRYPPSKPKSIGFSSDGSLISICYSPNAGIKSSFRSYGELTIHTFDNKTGTMSTQPLCELIGKPELSVPDAVSFSHDAMSSFIVVPSQSNDTIIFYSFDRVTYQIDQQFFTLKNPEAQLSFPHGISLSTDDIYLAVSNYGDDKVTVYSLKRTRKMMHHKMKK